MQTPEDVAQMLRLKAAGLGIKHIAREMGCSKNTVRRYLRNDGWVAYKRPVRKSALQSLKPWLNERLQQHRGNADVVRQDLQREHGITVCLRTVERAVAPFRRELRAAEVATVRYETAPGEQLQIDFGEITVPIAGERVKVHLFVATLGYSRRPYVAVFDHERQAAWLGGMEGAFHHFGGRTRELLLDNDQAAGLFPRCQDAGSPLQRSLPCLLPLLGRGTEGLCAISSAHEGEGRARGWIREAQCDRGSRLCVAGGARSTPCLVDARSG